jgi:hypothetical protein
LLRLQRLNADRKAALAAARDGRFCAYVYCRNPLTALRTTRRFCSDRCRQWAYARAREERHRAARAAR